ncbi:MAG: transcriptional regulator [Lysobacterales bacterium RIFOXYA1_FULL_68_6]|jgi:predicted XRE-type DNA-binding protein|nr:MAG: transcriptional regulator [Xanthomonadales bacterium RIFOXYA1_FULL_68_6]
MDKTSVPFSSVWDALADTAEEAANLKVRAGLMRMIASLIQESGWTQAAAAEHCGITQPRIDDLLRGRISRFSLDAKEPLQFFDGVTRGDVMPSL